MMRKRVEYWEDGDSGIFTDGTPFRLARVRAPESHQFGGERATRMAAGITGRSNGFVRIKPVARDAFGRLVVEMFNKDGTINNRLLRKGSKNKGR